ncbi:hypothetical protein FQN57_004047 [Myotisia sp. PD_48]|nr:hypothetical protein FQN57_004047 [Myotisia sp. PD_48]
MAGVGRGKWTPTKIWKAIGLDKYTFLMMLKGGLPPVILVAMFESTAAINVPENYSYISVIISVIAQSLLPRAKYTKIIIFSVLAVCVAASLSCLGVFCAVRARQHTEDPNDPPGAYNSSASAVAAIWFIFDIWIGNTIRAYRPIELQAPIASYSIFTAVSMTRAGRFGDLSTGLESTRQLLLTFLMGYAIATGVSFCILPVTSRGNFFQAIRSYPNAVKELLDAEITYVRHSEKDGPWQITRRASIQRTGSIPNKDPQKKGAKKPISASDANAATLSNLMNDFRAIHSRAGAELYYAKQELAWGKLGAEDLEKLFELFRAVFSPLAGIATIPEVLKKLAKTPVARASVSAQDAMGPANNQYWPREPSVSFTHETPEIGEHFIQPLCKRLETAAELVDMGFYHAFITLELAKAGDILKPGRKRKFSMVKRDLEAAEDPNEPGHRDFAHNFEIKLLEYFSHRKNLPQRWTSLNAFTPFQPRDHNLSQEARGIQKEFFVLILISHLQDVLLQAVLDLVIFADSKLEDGSLEANHFIFPKREALQDWFFGTGPDEGKSTEEGLVVKEEEEHRSASEIKRNDPLKSRYSDPEHLPPANKWQRFGNGLRKVHQFLNSNQSGFGLRVALAAFCAGILAFLKSTEKFFFENRINWVVIVIVIGMNRTSGHSAFSLFARVIVTTISTGMALGVWYIVAGKTPGVIVFLYVANCLQVRKLGLAKSTAGGLKYFPIYLFGPYRLVAVIAGCAISYIWVMFPHPTSARTQLRTTMGRSLFVLANFYSCTHTSISVWINKEQGDLHDDESPANLLDRARNKLLAEQLALLESLRFHSNFTKYELQLGGRFPKETYDKIISEIHLILTSLDLMARATKNLQRMTGLSRRSSAISRSQSGNEGRITDYESIDSFCLEEERWVDTLAEAAGSPGIQSHVVSSVLYHLSAAVSNSLSLPPYLAPPHPFSLARNLRRMNEDLLNVRNMEHPSFTAFIAIEVLSSMVSSNLKNLTSDIKLLVGELNFDVYVKPYRHRMYQEQGRNEGRDEGRDEGHNR